MVEPGRKFVKGSSKYRFGFNGKENDKEDGVVQYDYGFRIYDPRLVRFKSIDPLTQSYPYFSPYQFASNNPIANIDLDGLEGKCVIDGNMKRDAKLSVMSWRNIDYKVKEGNTIIMRLTFAKGPDDRDDMEMMLNDGGGGSEISIVEYSTNGRNVAINFFSGGIKGGLVKISGPVEPITFDNSYTAGILPRKSPNVEIDDIDNKKDDNRKKVTGQSGEDKEEKLKKLNHTFNDVEYWSYGGIGTQPTNASEITGSSLSELKKLVIDIKKDGSVKSISISVPFLINTEIRGFDYVNTSEAGAKIVGENIKKILLSSGVKNVNVTTVHINYDGSIKDGRKSAAIANPVKVDLIK